MAHCAGHQGTLAGGSHTADNLKPCLQSAFVRLEEVLHCMISREMVLWKLISSSQGMMPWKLFIAPAVEVMR